MPYITMPERKVNKPVQARGIAKVGDEIIWTKHQVKMVVTHVRENSVIAQFESFPVKGKETEFEFDNTVINHRNYQVVSKVKDKK